MNNQLFKQFVSRFLDAAVDLLGGVAKVRELHETVPAFVAGYVCGMIDHAQRGIIAYWRDDDGERSPPGFHKLTQEEIRRVHDFIRLRLETESTTS